MSRRLQDYAYDCPEELIAYYPAAQREESRLMVLDRAAQSMTHRRFPDILEYFKAGDVLVLNNSKVFPCRLVTQRPTGGRQEFLLLEPRPETEAAGALFSESQTEYPHKQLWKVMLNASRKVRLEDRFDFPGLRLTILSEDGNTRLALLEFAGNLYDTLAQIADIPLPPYIRRGNEALDRERYQTVFAATEGSVAAPTAGLHFTPTLLQQLRDKGVIITEVTLHVGPGTFLPVRSDDVTEHRMHAERFTIPQQSCDIINAAKREGRPVTCVGTTSVRVLETLAQRGPELTPQTSSTEIFIYPPYTFKIVDRLITNFHQSESTLLMLVSAFAGREFILSAYQEAVREKYRFFSYGDAMLIF